MGFLDMTIQNRVFTNVLNVVVISYSVFSMFVTQEDPQPPQPAKPPAPESTSTSGGIFQFFRPSPPPPPPSIPTMEEQADELLTNGAVKIFLLLLVNIFTTQVLNMSERSVQILKKIQQIFRKKFGKKSMETGVQWNALEDLIILDSSATICKVLENDFQDVGKTAEEASSNRSGELSGDTSAVFEKLPEAVQKLIQDQEEINTILELQKAEINKRNQSLQDTFKITAIVVENLKSLCPDDE